MSAMRNFEADMADALALRRALEHNAATAVLDADYRAAMDRAASVYRLNAAHARRIYDRAAAREISRQPAGTPSTGPAFDAGLGLPVGGATHQHATTRRTA